MELIYDFSAWVGKASLQSSLLAFTLWLLYTTRKTSGLFGIQYILGILIIARLCLPVTPSLEAHPFNWIKPGAPEVETTAYFPHRFRPDGISSVQPRTNALPATAAFSISPSTISNERTFEWSLFLPILWMVGFAFSLARILIAQIRHRSLVKSCEALTHTAVEDTVAELRTTLRIRQPIELLTSHQIGSAAVTGTIRPKLIVSPHFVRHLSDQQRRHVLVHELVHIKRLDPFVNQITLLLQAIHWFNPLVQWALRKFQQDRELVCDAISIKTLGESQRSAYGETLIEILTSFRNQRTFPNLVPIISNKHEIKRRIMMISMNQSQSSRRPIILIACLAAVLAITFTRPASVNAQSAPDKTNTFQEANADSPVIAGDVSFSGNKGHFVTAYSNRITLKDVSSRGRGDGVLVAPGSGKQMYNVHEIDVSAFESGGILLLDITMGNGESAGSFDLFPEGIPLPHGNPEGSVARSYDMPPGASGTMIHQFSKGQVFRFGASGNWFSEKGTTNNFRFEARAVPVNPSHASNATGASSPNQEFDFDFDFEFDATTPFLHSSTTSKSGAADEITLSQDGAATLQLVPQKSSSIFSSSKPTKAAVSKEKVAESHRTLTLPNKRPMSFLAAPKDAKISSRATAFVKEADGTVTTYIMSPDGEFTIADVNSKLKFDAKKKDSKEPKASN